MKKRLTIALMTGLLIVLGGCSMGAAPEEKIYETLEAAVSNEADFENQQQPMTEAEQKEQQLYNEIVELGMKEFDKIVELAEKAKGLAEERRTMLEAEKTSIDASKEEFANVNEYIEKLEDEAAKTKAKELSEYMNKRYTAYDELYNKYNDAIDLDLQLYEMFQKEDLELTELEGQIEKVNKSYEAVISANEDFNRYTDQFNKAKEEFYKAAELDVEYENNTAEPKAEN